MMSLLRHSRQSCTCALFTSISHPTQCKVCEEGVALHAQVGPDSMKELHHRMEELLEDYRFVYTEPNIIKAELFIINCLMFMQGSLWRWVLGPRRCI